VELDPELALARERLGSCLFGQKKYEAALAEYERALELDEASAASHMRAGVVQMAMYLQDQQREELRNRALGHWRRSLQLDPDQPNLQAILEKYTKQKVKIAPGESEG